MWPVTYSALIRTFNSAATLPATLECLERQSLRPTHYILVDSGSSDGTLSCAPPGSTIHMFQGNRFNYAAAINQGLAHVATDYVLIISSHTTLWEPHAIQTALELLETDNSFGGAYFSNEPTHDLSYQRVDAGTFTGHNGLSNSCSLLRVNLLRERAFRPEVFTAEDQEWARWLFTTKKKAIAKFNSADLTNNNPRRESFRKRLNENISVAYFSNPRYLEWRSLLSMAYRIAKPKQRTPFRDRWFSLVLLVHFLIIRVTRITPARQSRYW